MCYQLWVSSFEMLKSILLYISYMLLLRGKRIIAKKLEAIETKCKTIGWEMRNMMDYDGIWYVSKQDSTWIDLDLAVSVWFSDSVWCLAWLACLAWDLWDLWVAGCGEPPMAALPAAMSPAATPAPAPTEPSAPTEPRGPQRPPLWARSAARAVRFGPPRSRQLECWKMLKSSTCKMKPSPRLSR